MIFKQFLINHDIISSSYRHDYIMIVCPFHGDTSPSMKVNLDRDKFYCFGCHKSGNAIDFIKEIYGIDEMQAMKKAYEIGGTLDLSNERFKKDNDYDLEMWEESKRASKIVYDKLPELDWCNISSSYLIDKRNFSPQVLNKFKVKLNVMSQHSVCIPCIDNGEIVGLCNRAINDEIFPKYKFSAGFKKDWCLPGELDYNWPIVVTEGLLDMMTCYQYGYTNVTTTFSWSASSNHIERLKKSKVICAYDNDDRGEEGFQKLRKSLNVYRLKFDGKDLNDSTSSDFSSSMLKVLDEIRQNKNG